MEEWVGRQWHRFISQAADRRHAQAEVRLADMQQALTMLFRAGGGAPAVRLAPAAARRTGGPRGWLQRVAGSDTHAAVARLEPEALSLPPGIAVFGQRPLNRALYLWLAALAAGLQRRGDWLGDNLRATAWALEQFPGLQDQHQRLVQAQLALRPDPAGMKGAAAEAEAMVQRALRGAPPSGPAGLQPTDVAPVWLWLDTTGSDLPALARPAAGEDRPDEAAGARPVTEDSRRRQARAVEDGRGKAPLMMFFRAESILSWGEFVQVDRASDDEPDGNALAAADDMDELAIAPDGQHAASRVKFDLDLPSAAADDRPLGPGLQLPEWDFRQARLLPGHCALQTLVSTPPPYSPAPALRGIARRVRRRMEVLRAAPGRSRGQTEGDEIDLDAWVRHRVDAASAPMDESPAVFVRRVRSERSLATLLLADLSLSTDAYATQTARVIDVIRDALFVFGEALSASADPFEMLGFSSVRRQNVRIQHLKGFDEAWDRPARDRVGAIKPGYYTRMGAAIRLATLRLQARPERQRLLLLLTDGKPNDLDVYEGRYGLEDTRHAVQAARLAGLTPFCVTIDEQAHDYLPMLFGQQGYARVHRPQDLVQRLAAVHAQLTRH
ncbi:nitric oxide reductase NorD protein [Sphaerotilus hippei]|uniref:Nitric oxide reductase NorD protein n=1 Tax=Sphaerotilus hippei TaxID=744406 RepID=A0A318GXV6_9BURK|nr:VWA domain-containing protein [Sphaerotilus hippei]PXW93370.1 nitric oxide reductase NorD protein [Sphaerotilus hippei]